VIRAIVDANLLISFLLSSSPSSPVVAIIRAAIDGRFRMLVASETIEEARERTMAKPYLAARISAHDFDTLLRMLQRIADSLPQISGKIPAVSRDRKDDYLLAHAVAAQPDYLVTGDGDLLSFGAHGGVQIVDPATFAQRLGLIPEPDR
jgi:putative PIN family toxin of toxin-antitoxin system